MDGQIHTLIVRWIDQHFAKWLKANQNLLVVRHTVVRRFASDTRWLVSDLTRQEISPELGFSCPSASTRLHRCRLHTADVSLRGDRKGTFTQSGYVEIWPWQTLTLCGEESLLEADPSSGQVADGDGGTAACASCRGRGVCRCHISRRQRRDVVMGRCARRRWSDKMVATAADLDLWGCLPAPAPRRSPFFQNALMLNTERILHEISLWIFPHWLDTRVSLRKRPVSGLQEAGAAVRVDLLHGGLTVEWWILFPTQTF